jgi:hypothetical protein
MNIIYFDILVIGTSLNAFVGRTVQLVSSRQGKMGHMQTILSRIGNFRIVFAVILIVAELLVM